MSSINLCLLLSVAEIYLLMSSYDTIHPGDTCSDRYHGTECHLCSLGERQHWTLCELNVASFASACQLELIFLNVSKRHYVNILWKCIIYVSRTAVVTGVRCNRCSYLRIHSKASDCPWMCTIPGIMIVWIDRFYT